MPATPFTTPSIQSPIAALSSSTHILHHTRNKCSHTTKLISNHTFYKYYLKLKQISRDKYCTLDDKLIKEQLNKHWEIFDTLSQDIAQKSQEI